MKIMKFLSSKEIVSRKLQRLEKDGGRGAAPVVKLDCSQVRISTLSNCRPTDIFTFNSQLRGISGVGFAKSAVDYFRVLLYLVQANLSSTTCFLPGES